MTSSRPPHALTQTPRVLLLNICDVTLMSGSSFRRSILALINDILALVIRRWHWPSDDVTVKRSNPWCWTLYFHFDARQQTLFHGICWIKWTCVNEFVWLKVSVNTTLDMFRMSLASLIILSANIFSTTFSVCDVAAKPLCHNSVYDFPLYISFIHDLNLKSLEKMMKSSDAMNKLSKYLMKMSTSTSFVM